MTVSPVTKRQVLRIIPTSVVVRRERVYTAASSSDGHSQRNTYTCNLSRHWSTNTTTSSAWNSSPTR